MIKIDKINKTYFKNKSNELHVLKDISIEFDSYGITTIIGPSGSGKSTLLNVIGGLDSAKGNIIYDDTDFSKISSYQKDVYRLNYLGYIFQNYNLISNLTVFENLKLELDLLKINDAEEVEKRISNCLSVVGMLKYKNRQVNALSGGQQQRVAIARALIKGCKVILADEPTGNLDTKNSIEVMNILKVISKKCLIILVTHDANLANYYSDRIIKITDGKIISDEVNANDGYLLDSSSADSFYLDEYSLKNYKDDNNIEVYSNGGKINLRILIDSGCIYIDNKTNLDIKICGKDTNKVFLPSRPKVNLDDYSYLDNLNFKNTSKSNFKSNAKRIFNEFKKSFLNYIFTNKKGLLLNLCFTFIGIILCLCLCSLSYSTYVSDSVYASYPYESVRVYTKTQDTVDSYYGVDFEFKDLVDIISKDNGVNAVVNTCSNVNYSFTFIGDRNAVFSVASSQYISTPSLYGIDIKLKENEILISKKIADIMIKNYSNFGITSYDNLRDYEIELSVPTYFKKIVKIKKVIDLVNDTILVSDNLFYDYSSVPDGNTLTYSYLEQREPLDNLQYVGDENKDLQPEVFVSRNLTRYYSYFIRGYFDSDDFEVVFLKKSDYDSFIYGNMHHATIMMPINDDVKIIEGRTLESHNEIILPHYLKNSYPLGSSFSVRFATDPLKVVGYFEAGFLTTSRYAYVMEQEAYYSKLNITPISSGSYLDFYTNDVEKTLKFFSDCGYKAIYLKDELKQEALNEKMAALNIGIVISICAIVIMVVFIFLINRSKMLHNIYNIGVNRALGATKYSIYSKFVIDSITLATLTTLVGFVVTYILAVSWNSYMPGISFSLSVFFISILFIYVLLIISALLPIFLLLRKTPIEIINKYDI